MLFKQKKLLFMTIIYIISPLSANYLNNAISLYELLLFLTPKALITHYIPQILIPAYQIRELFP